jgi:hypothetical protein
MRIVTRAWHGLAIGIITALALGVTPSANAAPDQPYDREVEIVTFAGKCVDVYGAGSHNGAPIIQWDCTGNANQRFHIRQVGRGLVEIRTLHYKCLDVEGANPGRGTRILQWDCTGNPNQRFYLRQVGNGQVEIRTFSSRCFDVRSGHPDRGTPIIQWDCTTGANQHFTISD